MKDIQAVIIVFVLIVLSWLFKGVLWVCCRKKVQIKHGNTNGAIASNRAFNATKSETQKKNTKEKTQSSDDLHQERKKVCKEKVDNAEPEQTRYNAKKEGYESTEEIGLHLKERRNNLQEAMRSGNTEELATAIEWAMLDGCKFSLQDDLHNAQAKLKELQNIDRMRQNLYLMRPGLISELRSYSNPPKVVADVMMCVYMLLGMSMDQVKSWPAVQALLCSSGKNKLKRMIERHQLRDVAMKNFNDVKTILSKYDFQTVYAASEGAAAFYVWIREVVKELGYENAENTKRAD